MKSTECIICQRAGSYVLLPWPGIGNSRFNPRLRRNASFFGDEGGKQKNSGKNEERLRKNKHFFGDSAIIRRIQRKRRSGEVQGGRGTAPKDAQIYGPGQQMGKVGGHEDVHCGATVVTGSGTGTGSGIGNGSGTGTGNRS